MLAFPILTFHTAAFSMWAIETSTPGVYIDTGGNPNALIDTVRLENCNSYGYSLDGLQVTSGQYISVIGGTYTSNANAGIAITGAAANVIVANAMCIGNAFDSANTQGYGIIVENGATTVLITGCDITGNAQAGVLLSNGATNVHVDDCNVAGNTVYGISVTESCSSVYINGCNITGYSSGDGLNVSTPGTLQVINCPGYNDQAHTFTGLPISGENFNGVSYGYYGPVVFYVDPGSGTVSQITVAGNNTHLAVGSFFLGPPGPSGGPYGTISYSGSPYLLVVGK